MELSHALWLGPADVPAPLFPSSLTGVADTIALCWQAGEGLLNPRDDSPDIARTIPLIAAANLVVIVDSMVAHFASTFGRPTLILLMHEADWRWADGERTAWYPSAHLFRQHRQNDWTGLLAKLASSIRQAG